MYAQNFIVSSGGGDGIVKGEGPDKEPTLRGLRGQVGDESGDGADVGDDAEDDRHDGEPQSVTRRLARCLEVALRPRFVRLATTKSQDQNKCHLTNIMTTHKRSFLNNHTPTCVLLKLK